MKRLRALLVAAFVSMFSVGLAWNDLGHIVVAAIAWSDLNSTARKEVERLLRLGGTEKTDTFLTAACWADDTKTRVTAPWHYIDHHFRSDARATANLPERENVVWAIRRFTATLADRRRPDVERADALRYLIHFVGDVHQPLHGVSRDSDELRSGDRGGNLFKILSVSAPNGQRFPPKNLHALWDEGCGLFAGTRIRRDPLGASDLGVIRDLADRVVQAAGDEPDKVDDPMRWSLEDLQIARTKVYALTESEAPSAAYLDGGRAICARRVVLAGHRLARVLNRVLGQ